MYQVRLLCLATLALITFVVAESHAERPNVHLRVERTGSTETCIDERRLGRSVEERLGRRVFDAAKPPELRVLVEFGEAERYDARIELSDSVGVLGHREISTAARHCSALDDSVALVVALLVDTPPERPAPPEQSSRPTEAVISKAREAPPASTPIRLPARTLAPREPFDFDARLGGALGVGQLPAAALGGELALGLRPPRGPWFRLLAEVYAPSERRLGNEGGGVRLGLQRLGLELCGLSLALGALRTELCAGQRLGRLAVTGIGFQENRELTKLSASVTLGGHAFLPLGQRFGAYAGIHGEIPLVRQEFTARPDGQDDRVVFQPSPAGLIAKAGLRVEL